MRSASVPMPVQYSAHLNQNMRHGCLRGRRVVSDGGPNDGARAQKKVPKPIRPVEGRVQRACEVREPADEDNDDAARHCRRQSSRALPEEERHRASKAFEQYISKADTRRTPTQALTACALLL